MADMNDIVKVAVDAYHGNVEQYSVGQSMDLMRKALVDLNGGSTTMNYKNIRDGKCSGLFTLIEEILSRTVSEGLTGNEFFYNLVDYRNVPEGDKNIFVTEDSNLFVVSDVADGTQGIRRQRLGGQSQTSIPTTMKMVKIYEEMNRVLSGRVDFNYFINKVSESFRQQLLDDIYTLWSGATADDFGGTTYFPTAGAYSDDELLELIAHVEAAAGGKPATIICTKKAARNLAPSVQGSDSQSDIYNNGYYGKFFGTPVVVTPQRHKVKSTEFVMRDDVITVIAGDDKPIKCVREGNPILVVGNPADKADFTYEYLYGEKYGLAILLAGGNAGIGRYEIA